MRKIFTASTAAFTHLMTVAAVVCMSSVSAHAADPVDFGEMQLDTNYAITQYTPYSGTFTSPQSGTLKVESVSGNASVNAIYADAAHSEMINGVFSGYTASPRYYAYEVTEGTTYYFYNNFPWDSGEIRLTMNSGDVELEYQRSQPEEDSALSATGGYPYIDIYFTENVGSLTSCALHCDGTEIKLAATPMNNTLHIDIESAVLSLYKAGIKGGADLALNIAGLKSASGKLYNGDGNLTLHYTLANEPVQLLSSKVPDVFKSYWAPGSADALCTFTFSGDLSTSMPADRVNLTFGSAELEGKEFYLENVPFSVDGSVLTVDLAGVRRTPSDMVASGTNYGNLTLTLYGITAADGQAVYSGGQGTNGSFFYDWTGNGYLVLDKGAVIADFDPANGSSLKDASQISVWIQGVDAITFDGFTLTAENGGEAVQALVPMSAVTVENDGDAKTYTFDIPAAIKGKTGVTVTLTNVVGLDGYDHSDDVKASYDTFVITGCDPAGGTEMARLDKGTVITVTTNYAELYPELYMMYEIEDLNPEDPTQAIIKTQSWLNRQEDGSYTASVYGNYKLLKNHKYAVRFTAWESEMAKNYHNDPLGTAEIYWFGLTAPFEYSEITLTSITPDPANAMLSAEDNKFVLKFDGSVNINAEHAFINSGMGLSTPFESIEPVNGRHEVDGVVYNDEWQLTAPVSYMEQLNASLFISVQAYDENGLIVRGNEGTEENTYFSFEYQVGAEYREVELSPAAGSEVESLSRFIVSSEEGINQSFQGTAYLMNLADRVTYSLKVSMGEGDLETGNTEMYLDLENEITTPGRYVLHVDAGFFILGSQFTTWKSAEINAEYYIVSAPAPGEDDKRTVTPDPSDKNLTELSEIDIFYDDHETVGIGAGKATLTIGDADPVELPDAEYGTAWNEVLQPLGQTYTEEATYVVSFPEGYFLLGDNGDNSKAFALVYTIGNGSSGVAVIAADANGEYNVYTLAGVRVLSTRNASDLASLASGFYVINGKKVYIK